MKNGMLSVLLGAGMALAANVCPAAESTQVEKVQAALAAWLAARAPIEEVTGIAAYISFGDAGPAIEAFAGTVGRDPGADPVDQDTLYQMGSTSKSFAVAVILKLEAAGKPRSMTRSASGCPQYPAWQDVTIRRLLNMTSGIPNYSETEWMSRAWADQPKRDFTMKELVAAAYPSATNRLPENNGYFYSNTNYVLAGMIAEEAAGKTYRDLVHDLIIEPHGLYSTFYEAGTYPESVVNRLSHGYFENQACADYQPGCKESWNLPIMGRDMREASTSWAQACRRRDFQRPRRRSLDARRVPREGGAAEAAAGVDAAGFDEDGRTDRRRFRG